MRPALPPHCPRIAPAVSTGPVARRRTPPRWAGHPSTANVRQRVSSRRGSSRVAPGDSQTRGFYWTAIVSQVMICDGMVRNLGALAQRVARCGVAVSLIVACQGKSVNPDDLVSSAGVFGTAAKGGTSGEGGTGGPPLGNAGNPSGSGGGRSGNGGDAGTAGTSVPSGSGGGRSGNGGDAGTAGASVGPTLDTSVDAGVCGQYTYDLTAYCESPTADGPWSHPACVLATVPDCAMLSALYWQPSGKSVGCGFLRINLAESEGDAVTEIYDSATGKLVYYEDWGYRAAGCGSRGARIGIAPSCDAWTNLCPSGDGGAPP
jgi:hypothetical protein